MNYTPAQTTAIRYPDENLLVSAAAGSGKTATLTERILYLLRHEKASLSRMLIVTYTRAAAAELRSRIGQKITEEAKVTGSRKMARHLTELPGAQISTIHAFLYRTLRPSFAALGLTPDFTIGDEATIDTLRQEAMQDTLDDLYLRGEPDFITLADTLAVSRDTEALDRTLLTIYAQITSAGETPATLEAYSRELASGKDFFAMPQSRPIQERIRSALHHYRNTLSRLHMEFDDIVESKYGAALQGDLDWLDGLETVLATGDYGQVRQWFNGYQAIGLGRLASKDATDASDAFKAVRSDMKKDILRLAGSFFSDPPELVAEAIDRTAELLSTTAKVLSAYADAFRARKMSRSLLDYADLESLALGLFLDENGQPTESAKEVGKQFSYIFVDEYQDTNRVQDAIFRALAGETPRFLVGDSKQSIYRFRGAEPSVFARYRECWPTQMPQAADTADGTEAERSNMEAPKAFDPDAGHCLFMSENFRCDRTVVDFVNLVSELLFPCSAMPYTTEDALVFGKGSGGTAPAEIVLVEKPSAEDEEGKEDKETTDDDPEAEYVAERIATLLRTETVDDRPLDPSDFAILLRSPDTNGAAYAHALAKRGIPVQLPGGTLLFASPVVQLTMCLLHVADNPLYDIPVAGAMHSPLFGFATHELVLLRDKGRKLLSARYSWDGDMPLYTLVELAAGVDMSLSPDEAEVEDAALASIDAAAPADVPVEKWKTPVENSGSALDNGLLDGDNAADPVENPVVSDFLPPELVEKCRVFHKAVQELREMAHGMRADRFLDTLFREYALFDLPEVQNDPVEKANLEALYDLARRYESGAFGGVGGFLTYTEELQAKAQGQNGEDSSIPAVHILSIHRSKGLEFPVVFVSSCSKRRNSRDEMGDILYDVDLGFGMRLPDKGGYARCGTALRSAIAEKKRLESVEEEMRVVYVALTRARNRLIVTGKVKDAETFLADCRFAAEYASPYSITGSCTYLEWIATAALAHGPDPCYRFVTVTPTTADTTVQEPETVTEAAEAPVADRESLLAENLSFRYAYTHLAGIPTKLSVSQLHPGILDTDTLPVPEEDEVARSHTDADAAPAETMPLPHFLRQGDAPLTAAQRGTATHQFLQFMDLQRLATEGVQAELTRLVEQHFLDEKTAGGVYVTHIQRFRESDLFRRMCASPLCHREFRFNAPLPASRFTNDPVLQEKLAAEDVQLIVQGVVDCVFREPDGTLTLVDYKTDRPTAEARRDPAMAKAQFLTRHGEQLSLYREICSQLFGETIHKALLYSTVLGEEICMDE